MSLSVSKPMTDDVKPVECARSAAYVLEPLSDGEAAAWDELVAPYPGRELFHRSAWLAFLERSRDLRIRRWRISHGGDVVGHFCAGLLWKGPYAILGSPLRGWGTNFMGPLMREGFRQEAFLDALDELAAREDLAMIELENSALDSDALQRRGYVAAATRTYLVTLGDSEAMWRSLRSTCRNRIRKAEKAGLVVEQVDDLGFADVFYDQYRTLLRRKAMAPHYPRGVPQALFASLHPSGLLFALRVRDRAGRVLATGLFPHDDRTLYFWGGASSLAQRELCPNELLQWRAMVLAAEHGLTRYNMCGDGRFKQKFGGALVELRRWRRWYGRTSRFAHAAYEAWVGWSGALRGWMGAVFRGDE